MLGIKVKVSAVKLGRKLDKLKRPLANRTPMLKAIGEAGTEWILENFAKRGRLRMPGGWKPLRPNTIAAKGYDQPLVTYGDLALSFYYTIAQGQVRLRSDSPIARFHEFGTKGPYDIPKNPPMPAGKYLAFMTTGGMVFAKQVKHPGLPRRPMLPTVDLFRVIARTAARKYVDGVVEKANAAH